MSAPRRLIEPQVSADIPPPLTRAEAEALGKRALAMSRVPLAFVSFSGQTSGSSRFARNEVSAASDSSSLSIRVTSFYKGRSGVAEISQFDDESLRKAITLSETLARAHRSGPFLSDEALGPETYLQPELWKQSTLPILDPLQRFPFVRSAMDASRAADMEGAGFIEVGQIWRSVSNNKGLFAYANSTFASFTMSARTRDGMASGWAGRTFPDWARINPDHVIARAIDIAKRSRNPVAIEPGRYTVILEPNALAAMWQPVMVNLRREAPVFTQQQGGSKIGLRMLDARISVVADPMHPDGGFNAFDIYGTPIRRTVWFENGVLKQLPSTFLYSMDKAKEQLINTQAAQMTGGTATLEEMIASTRRGVWVNRFSALDVVDARTLMETGVTRDGAFLIENGKITKPIKNLRFNESPFFILNNVEVLGVPERVAIGGAPMVMPRVKVRDFTFTSLSDAV
ncbi:MAG: TldD/PmbA family protein [Gemmatimonadaceae bacterium]|nr:TldD/PmbA family protein [Gemmatimonadaceae bacterium]